MELFEIQNLTFTYPEQDIPVLRDISLILKQGDFAVLAGPSGCGKSTLLRQMKTVLTPHGHREGGILYHGRPLHEADHRTQAAGIGFVMQDPDSQIVTDKVWHELAFGLESLGMDQTDIRGRVAEMAGFFGIQTWFHRDITELSGGQKQLLNLASVLVMQPDILILDEPSSQLDPVAATDFLHILGRINRELGITILICEHRLEEVLSMADRLLVLDQGRLIADDTPAEVFVLLREQEHTMLCSMPTPMQIWNSLHWDTPCPITVSEGRKQLTTWSKANPIGEISEKNIPPRDGEPCLILEHVWFRYEKDTPDILKNLSMKAYPGELVCILGGNGTGKSTALSVIGKIRKPYRGKLVCRKEKVALLPQNPQTLLVKKSVHEELLSVFSEKKTKEVSDRMGRMIALCQLEELLNRHPYDLSGGEQQRTALAKVLLREPQILLLDEPTKGLDHAFKEMLARILKQLTAEGICILMVSHDIEFCARYGDYCGLFFDGTIVSFDAPQPFFSGKSFYTTAANRMARHLLPNAVTPADVITACGGQLKYTEEPVRSAIAEFKLPEERKPEKLPRWKKVLACLTGSICLALLLYTFLDLEVGALYQGGQRIEQYVGLYLVMFLSFGTFSACISRRASVHEQHRKKKKLSTRTKAAILLSLLLIPFTIWLGFRMDGGRRYMLTSLVIIGEMMLPFFLAFEGRKPQARELVILSVLSALAIGGRAVFFALPGFKPVAAMVILTGVVFGAEAGFMVGSMTMFCSNILFGQGPWTPWQMFAMGIIGLLAGILFRKGFLHRERFSLSVFGGLVTFLVYGGIMNPASVLMYQPEPDWGMLVAAYITGIPADIVHALASAMFLWFLSEPMLEQLDRVKVKYGLLER